MTYSVDEFTVNEASDFLLVKRPSHLGYKNDWMPLFKLTPTQIELYKSFQIHRLDKDTINTRP